MYSVSQLKQIINQQRQNYRSFTRKVRIRLSIDEAKISHLKPTIDVKKKWYGSSYGGFFVCPEYVNNESVVYSFGIGKDISFDRKVIAKHGCKVHGFDPTPKSINYIKAMPVADSFSFFDYGIASKTGVVKFFLPKNEKAVSASLVVSDVVDEENFVEAKMKSFADITADLGHQQVDVLKMDIEGAEYEVIDSLLNSNVVIRQLLVEFHDRLFTDEIKSKATVRLLQKNGFEIFGASLNYEEISFINTKLLPRA